MPRFWSGVPVRRGPIESKSVCASFWTCELSMPMRKMRSIVPDCCAESGAAAARASGTRRERRRGIEGRGVGWVIRNRGATRGVRLEFKLRACSE